MALALLDSAAIVALLDSSDRLHRASEEKLRDLGAGHKLISSVVVFAEVMTGVARGHHEEEVVRRFFQRAVTQLLPVDLAVAERGAQLRGQRRSLRLPDALILATADQHPDTELIVTADAAWADVPGLRCRVEAIA